MSQSKLLAYYLPAFHEIKENDEWYGKGFTEWDNTKRAKKLFRTHYQPRVPLEYYDLSNEMTMIKQSQIAKEYGVDGFIFYHYWFNPSGYKILEKPVEKYLELNSKDKIEYCFCWANESWRRTWHDGNGESELLIEQKYGDEEDWRMHFEYLLPFFKDKMYIKVDDKPMIIIYRPGNITNYNNLLRCWNKLAKDNGFNGVFVVRLHTNSNSDNYQVHADANALFEPSYSLDRNIFNSVYLPWRIHSWITWHLSQNDKFAGKVLNKINYKAFSRTMVKDELALIKAHKDNWFLSIFNDWDNSPRKGKRGIIFLNANPNSFYTVLSKEYAIANKYKIPFIFCFAWNEWGEGGYLEPDNKYNFGFLEAIRRVKNEQ